MSLRSRLAIAPAQAIATGLAALPSSAWAHSGERGYIMLLPTTLYIAGGTLAVLLTFLILVAFPVKRLGSLAATAREFSIGNRTRWLQVPSALSLLLVIVLAAAGHLGDTDPLLNPLPTTIWSLLWIGMVFATVALGNLWSWLAPWRALDRSLAWLPLPRLELPARLSAWPAVVLLLALVWFENVYPAAQDPRVLANVLIAYVSLTALGMRLFGRDAWLHKVEVLSVYFRMVSWLAPLQWSSTQQGRITLRAGWPGGELLRQAPFDLSRTAFVLAALAAVSFDGFSKTFSWLALLGENPLEPPGRTDLMLANTAGLLAAVALLSLLFAACVRAGERIAQTATRESSSMTLAGTIVPIAFAYHVAHYLPVLLIDGQFALIALSDPFALDWNLLGLTGASVKASLSTHHGYVETVWYCQLAAIVAGHAIAVVLVRARMQSTACGVARELPLTMLMIAYTFLGLWLLSTPAI